MRIRKGYNVVISFLGIFIMAGNVSAQVPANKPNGSTQPLGPTVAVNGIPDNYLSTIKVNFVRTRTALGPMSSEPVFDAAPYIDVTHVTQYSDGLGRPLQSVARQGSPTAKDIVAPVIYDALGRETYKYLPYTQTTGGNTNDGMFKQDAFNSQATFYQNTTLNPGMAGEQAYYGQVDYEASPLNRVNKTMEAGNSWAGSGRGVTQKYLFNTAADDVRIWDWEGGISDPYETGTLYKLVTIDENNNAVVEYKDKEGKVILKKVQSGTIASDYSGYIGFLSTYYVYDAMNRLRAVWQPKRVDDLVNSNWQSYNSADVAFEYVYDDRGRLVTKKVPGASEVYMVYDQRDRLVFIQDGNMRAGNKWLATLYDVMNRPVLTGMITYAGDRTALQEYVNSATGNTATEIISTSSPGNINLFVDERNTSLTTYQANNSITFTNAFQSEANAEFTAVIVTVQSINESVTIMGNPLPPGHNMVALTITYYDNYDWTNASYSTTFNSQIDAGNNLHAESLPAQSSSATLGMVTGAKVRVIEDPNDLAKGAWLTSVTFYDDKGRAVQNQSTNYKGGTEILTSRYDFSGKVLTSYLQHHNPAAGSNSHMRIKTNMEYDHGGRLLETFKTINDDADSRVLIAKQEYNELGQLTKKMIGQKKDENGDYEEGSSLETQDYVYNIRGWLQGINKDYARGQSPGTTPWFGMELNYDWGFTQQSYNGNITGSRWRSRGDGEQRAFGYTYDKVNRIMSADFSQHEGSAYGDNVNGINFDMMMGDGTSSSSAYDPNGNILAMKQWGWKPGGSTLIDDLTYQYMYHSSNQLMKVTDAVNDVNSKLGDFKEYTTPAYNGSAPYDYLYDDNGNMVMDLNKGIRTGYYVGMSFQPQPSITYNHLNLPYTILIAQNGDASVLNSITYIYDAVGNKLEKRVKEDMYPGNQNPAVTRYRNVVTTYIGGFVYRNNKLQLISHEEGRIRPVPVTLPSGTVVDKLVFDYFLKDHLGNVRMVLTEEQETKQYLASMEQQYRQTEEQLFFNIPQSAIEKGFVPGGYPADATTDPNDFVAKLNGSSQKVGPAIVLKVMSGDKVDIGVKSFFRPHQGPEPTNSPVEDLLAALANGIVGAAGGTKGTQSELSNPETSPLLGALGGFRGDYNPDPENDKPKAYLNWILLDEQFQLVNTGSQSGAKPITTPDILETLAQSGIEINKSGYLYIYVSNETENWDVFFDNLAVKHFTGPLVEETHYYPFGLTMAGISAKGLGKLDNKNKYNGKEKQANEFSDGTGSDWYDYGARMFDAQIGRWNTIDPMAEVSRMVSPYVYAYNNPIRFLDPKGLINVGALSRETDEQRKRREMMEAKRSGHYIADAANPNDFFRNTQTGEIKWFFSNAKSFEADGKTWENIGQRVGHTRKDGTGYVYYGPGDGPEPGNDVYAYPMVDKYDYEISSPLDVNTIIDDFSQLLNVGGVVWGKAELTINAVRQIGGPKDIGRFAGFGTQRTANALKGVLNTSKSIGKNLGIAGMALSTYSYGSAILSGGHIKASTHANFWIGATLFTAAAIIGGPYVAAIALVYGAAQLASYMYNGKTLEQNILND